MKTCALLGINGYIGRHLAKKLLSEGYTVTGYDIQDSTIFKDIPYKKIDISDRISVNQIDLHVDHIFYFSGITGTLAGFEQYEKYILTNELGLVHLLQKMKAEGSKARLFFPSTRLVYKGSNMPLDEDAEKEARTIYAVNKIASELLLQAYQNSFGIEYSILRICVPYGNSFDSNYSFGTIGNFLSKLENESSITLFGDGLLKRTFTHIDDLTDQIILTVTSAQGINQVFNTVGETFSLLDIATIMIQKYGGQIIHIPWPERDFRIESGHTFFNSEKFKKSFKYENSHFFNVWLSSI